MYRSIGDYRLGSFHDIYTVHAYMPKETRMSSYVLYVGNTLNCAIQRLEGVGRDSRPGSHDCKANYII